jgi:hypothetical protein
MMRLLKATSSFAVSVRPSVCLSAWNKIPLNEFSGNLIFARFAENLFPKLKIPLRGKRFKNIEEVSNEVT